MFSFAHGAMLSFKTFPRKVYHDVNKENKKKFISVACNMVANVALLPPNYLHTNTHTKER